MEIYPKKEGNKYVGDIPFSTEPWLCGGRIYEGCWLDMTRPRFREDYMTFDCEGCLWWDICWWKVSWTDMNLRGRRSLPILFRVFCSVAAFYHTFPTNRATARGVHLSCEDGYINVTESTCERSSHCAGGAVEVQKPENSVNHGICDNLPTYRKLGNYTETHRKLVSERWISW